MKSKFDLYSRTNQLIIDGSIVTCSFAAAYLIRFEGLPPIPYVVQCLFWVPVLLALRLLVNWTLLVYRFTWRFICLSDAVVIARSLSLVTAALLLLRLSYPVSAFSSRWIRLPLSVIVLEGLLSLIVSIAARSLRRMLHERERRRSCGHRLPLKRMILYGAGRAGILLLRELQRQSSVEVIGFVDDDPQKIGTIISGTHVMGSGESLGKLVTQFRIDEVVISMATASRKTLAEVWARCKEIPVPSKIIPSLQEIVNGPTAISYIREIRLEDLLGRNSIDVPAFNSEVREAYASRRILVTGAGGSIGSELVRKLCSLNPEAMAILDKDENSVYELEQELIRRGLHSGVQPIISDIRDRDRLSALFTKFRPQVVFHAAAHKHVPLMELHPCEAVLNNVCGTQNLLEAASKFGTERFVFISSDKEINPTNVMGATKRIGEKLVQAYANVGGLQGACVRFGNVMGSRGSVIPLFQKQIADGGPITITHPEIVRLFMTIPEAVQLILCAGSVAHNGEVFVLDIGRPRKILDVAREMISLSGLEPGKDIKFRIVGLRPGEKMSEELSGVDEDICGTQFDKISMIVPQPLNERSFSESISRLARAAKRNDRDGIYSILLDMDLGFYPQFERAQAAAVAVR
jgi:FlaA1/EpsC-like NDP-sugar epimerase